MDLFAYGTLELPELMRSVAGAEFTGTPAVLQGYGRYLLRGRPYPGIRLRIGHCTRGTLYAGITTRAWSRLDRYEATCYRKARVTVTDVTGRRRCAVTYVVKSEYHGRLGKRAWDAAHFGRAGSPPI